MVDSRQVECYELVANDFHCSEDDITLEELGGTSYRAKGCGYNEVYDCSGSSVHTNPNALGGGGGTSNYVCIPEKARSADED